MRDISSPTGRSRECLQVLLQLTETGNTGPKKVQSFQSWQMWRHHSQDRWSSLSSSVKRDLTT